MDVDIRFPSPAAWGRADTRVRAAAKEFACEYAIAMLDLKKTDPLAVRGQGELEGREAPRPPAQELLLRGQSRRQIRIIGTRTAAPGRTTDAPRPDRGRT